MDKISYEQYAEMTDSFRKACRLSDMLINATQRAFGGVNDVAQYYEKGLVVFCNGDRWMFNYNKRYPTFYNVTNQQSSKQFKKAY